MERKKNQYQVQCGCQQKEPNFKTKWRVAREKILFVY